MPGQVPEIIPLSTAAQMATRSPKTVRRWIREGKLQDKRAQGDRYSPVIVSAHELRGYLSTLSQGGNGHGHPRAAQPSVPGNGGGPTDIHFEEALKDQLVTKQDMIDGLKEDKARLLSQVSQLQTELSDVRMQLTDCQQARAAVERELVNATQGRVEFREAIADLRRQVSQGHRERSELERQMRGGVRGLLRGAVKRLRR